MEEVHHARRSSGIYEGRYGSTTGLAANAEQPAGSRFSEGVTDQTPPGSSPGTAAPAAGAAAGPKKPFYKRRKFIICQIILAILGIVLLFVLLFPVVSAIAQLVVNRSVLNVDLVDISSAANDSFTLHMEGVVTHTGFIPAHIAFTEPVNIDWKMDNGTYAPIGQMRLSDLHASHKRAYINDTTTFEIKDQAMFGEFSQYLITQQNFTWRLYSNKLNVQAAKFPTSKGINFDKLLTLNGFNSFNGNVRLKEFLLPQDHEGGGIDFSATTTLTNPSPFQLNLGTVQFDLSYNDVFLGLGTGTDTNIKPGDNDITLTGFLVPHNDSDSDLEVLGKLFTQYINGEESPVIAQGKSTLQSDGTAISWLSEGLQALKLQVPFKPDAPINPINTISIGDFALAFDEETPWSPSAESHTVQATLKLPFGFSLSIGEIANDFNISKSGAPVAGLSTPVGASTSDIRVLGSTDTQGTVNISIAGTNLSCPDPEHPTFSLFNANLTSLDSLDFQLVGNSRAIANMSIGQITLDPIKVDVTTNLLGLKGLKGLVNIEGVDVTGGQSDGIVLAINVSMFNPSNLYLNVGNLNTQLFRDGSLLGTTLLPNLNLTRGNNSIQAIGLFDANSSPNGLQTLSDFVGHKDTQLSIAGYDRSTNVSSLVEAFNTLNLDVILPGLTTSLLDSASLKVLNSTGRENNITHVTVDLANPFSADLTITHIRSTVTQSGLMLGSIDTPTKFDSQGHGKTTSPALDLNLNFDPETLFTVTRILAVDAGLDVAPLDGIVQLGGYTYLKTTGPPVANVKRDNLYTGFNLPNFVNTAFKQLKTDVELIADITIGDYSTSLTYSQSGLPTKTDESLDLILPILAHPIVEKIVAGSGLGIDTVLIKDPHQEDFTTGLKGSITNAGPFDADIAFPSGLTIAWNGSPLGSVKLDSVKVVGDVGATLDLDSNFQVADVGHLTDFTKTLVTDESFTWDISGQDLTVSALGIDVPDIPYSTKSVTLKGFNGLKNGVIVNSFDLPSNDPAGGIHLTLQATTINPSQVGVELSSLSLNTFASGVMIAPVSTDGGASLQPMSSTNLSLVGRLVPQSSSDGLAAVSGVFNNFIHGQDSDLTVQGSGAGPSDVTWLNEGIKALQVGTVLPNQGKLNIIKSISLNELELFFTTDTAYDPSSTSKDTQAAFTLPFGFPVDIVSLEQTIGVSYQDKAFAQLALPKASTKTDVEARIVHLTFDNVPFAVSDDGHSTFNDFVAATTMGKSNTLGLSGSSNADADTAVGVISLTDIDFNVDSSVQGLQGLNVKPVTVANLDVNHGFPDYLLIKVDSAIFDPSNLTVGTGDVAFDLIYMNSNIGSVHLNDLVIRPGNASYATDVHYSPTGDAVSAGQQLLENFLQGIDVDTTIQGTTDSSPIQSLQEGLSQIKLSPVTIPAIHETLIKSTSLEFPLDIVATGIAQASFTLADPFTASINLLKVGATALYHNLTLGKIDDVDVSSNPIHADGHSSVTSPNLPLKFNLDKATLVKFLSLAAQSQNVDLGPLVDIFQFVLDNLDFNPPVNTSVDTNKPTCVSGKQFDVEGAILKSLQNLKVDLAVDSDVKLDDYPTSLSFNQNGVPAITDNTALYLIGALAGPVAQHFVDDSQLSFSEANITNISNEGFDLSLQGSLTDTGPLDAQIEFTEPVTVNWQGHDIATISLPPVCAAANSGVPNYATKAHLTITDQDQFTAFATFLLHNPSFDWTISTDKLRVTALNTIFDGVSLSKKISFKAFNNLPGVSISNFQLPSDDPAGGIHIETDAVIPSPAQLGIELGTVVFDSYFQDVFVGPLSSGDLFLAAQTRTSTHLSGRIVPQSGQDLDTIGVLFTNFLQGKNQTLVAKGDSVKPDGQNSVDWLSAAFKTLSLDVTLPGQKFNIIQSITLGDLEVTLETQDQAYAPPTSSKSSLATYKNPFGFSLQVVEAGPSIILASGGVQIAQLNLPLGPANGGVSTGNVADLVITWENQPLKSLNNDAFNGLFAQVTNAADVNFELQGSSDVVARTSIGDVPIGDIPFDVPSSLKGINAFGHVAQLSNVSVAGSGGNGGNEYIRAPLTTGLENPSNVSLSTVDIGLPVSYKGVMLGRAFIAEFNLVPGENDVATEFRYEPENANDTVAQGFLAEFIATGDTLDLSIHGDTSSSPIPSLQEALSLLTIQTSLKGLNHPTLITHITVTITLESLITNEVQVDIDINNPLDAPLTITFVQSDSGVEGDTYAHFDQAFSGFTIPPGQTVNSGQFDHVLLVKGAIASLGIIPLGYLDVQSRATVQVGENGYEIPWLPLNQDHVPTTYELSLGLTAMKEAAQSISESSIAATATTSKSASAEASATSSSDGDTTSSSSASSTEPEETSTQETNNSPTVQGTTPTVQETASKAQETAETVQETAETAQETAETETTAVQEKASPSTAPTAIS